MTYVFSIVDAAVFVYNAKYKDLTPLCEPLKQNPASSLMKRKE